MAPPNLTTLCEIHNPAMKTWLSSCLKFVQGPINVGQAAKSLIQATLELHEKLRERFSKQSTLFSWHCVHRQCQKLTKFQPSENQPVTIANVWCIVAKNNYQGTEIATATDGVNFLNQCINELTHRVLFREPALNCPVGSSSRAIDVNSANKKDNLEVSLIPFLTPKGVFLKPTSSPANANPANLNILPFLVSKTLQSIQSLMLEQGHVILWSQQRWTGKKYCARAAANYLGYALVDLTVPCPSLDSDVVAETEIQEARNRCVTVSRRTSSFVTHHRNLTVGRRRTKKFTSPKKSRIPVYSVNRLKMDPKFIKEITAKKLSKEEFYLEKIQKCLHYAGVKGRPVLLLYDYDPRNTDLLDTVYSLMVDGDCRWLRSLQTSDQIVHYMQLLFTGSETEDRRTMCAKFKSKIRKNLHVAVCVNSSKSNIGYPLSHFTSLVRFGQWSSLQLQQYGKAQAQDVGSQVLEMLSKIHQTASACTGKYYNFELHPNCLKRAAYWFRYYSTIQDPTKDPKSKWQKGYEKLISIREQIKEIALKTKPLSEQQMTQDAGIDICEDSILAFEEEYSWLQNECALEEEVLNESKRHLDQAQSGLRELLGDIEPEYAEALNQLLMLIPSRLMEVKSYRAPTTNVTKVLGAFCFLFGQPQNWDNVKQFLSVEYLPALIQHFDRESLNEETYQELGKLVKEPNFEVATVAQSSEAAAAVCRWIHMVYRFLDAKFSHQELYGELDELRTTVETKELHLKQERETLEAVENELNSRKQELKDLERSRTKVSVELAQLQQESENYEQLLFATSWAERRWSSRNNPSTTVSFRDAIIAACTAVYSSYMDSERRTLFENEMVSFLYHESNPRRFDTPKAIVEQFVSRDTKSVLLSEGIPSEPATLNNFLTLKLHLLNRSCQAVISIDPLGLSRKWSQLALELNPKCDSAVIGLLADDPQLVKRATELRARNVVFVVEDAEYLTPDKWTDLVIITGGPIQGTVVLTTKLNFDQLVTLNPDLAPFLWELPVLYLGASDEGLNHIFTQQLLKTRHPDLYRHVRELEELYAIEAQEAERSESELVTMLLDNSWHLARLEDISKRQDQIAIRLSQQETYLEKMTIPHKEATEVILILKRRVLPQIAMEYPGIDLSLNWLLNAACQTVYDEDCDELDLTSGENQRVANCHLWAILNSFSNLFGAQQLENIAFLLALEIYKKNNPLKENVELAMKKFKVQDCSSQKAQLDSWPETVKQRVWTLQNDFGAVFGNLVTSLSSESARWQNYIQEPFSIGAISPLSTNQLPVSHQFLLRQALCPNQVSQTRWTFASNYLGPIINHCRSILLADAPCKGLRTVILEKDPTLTTVYYDGSICDDQSTALEQILSTERATNIAVFHCNPEEEFLNQALAKTLKQCCQDGDWLVVTGLRYIKWDHQLSWAFRTAFDKPKCNTFKVWVVEDSKKTPSAIPTYFEVCTKLGV